MLRRPIVPPHCEHNAHMFYILVQDAATRTRLLQTLNDQGINAVFHYIPLHSSKAGRALGRAHGPLTHTDSVSERLVRLPLWYGLDQEAIDSVVSAVERALR